jgi:phosphopantetheinyl transferase
MGNFPQVKKPVRTPITIELHAHLADHHFMGTPVLPAVEAMEILAADALASQAIATVGNLTDAQFNKFMPLDPQQNRLEAISDRLPASDGSLQTMLLTRTRAPKAAITRIKTHAQVTFEQSMKDLQPIPLDIAAAPEGICESVAQDRLYEELVPFGPAYRNIAAPLWLSVDGALAKIHCPDLPCCSSTNHLGSPFALDAAFHAACVWGQHFLNMVAFPVAVAQRRILRPTQPGHIYWGRVIPQHTDNDLLIFNIWLLNQSGKPCEIVQGVRMRDVSGGRLQPPSWIQQKNQQDPLAALKSHCLDLAVIELDALADFVPQSLSPQEKQRYEGMGERRSRSYLGARMALKRLSRKLRNDTWHGPAQEISTLSDDGIRPYCPAHHASRIIGCSASHDRRFAIAAAAKRALGIDVETVSDRAVKCSQLYMNDKERQLFKQSTLGRPESATRIWSVKEAVAKATNTNLAETWQRTEILAVADTASHLHIDGHGPYKALHTAVDDHIFTLFIAG